MVEVLRLTPDDWRLWRSLRRAALAEDPQAFGSSLADWSGDGDTEPRWRPRLTAVALHLVLTLDGEPVGVVSATAPGGGDAAAAVELLSLWVAPRARGHGVGDEAVRRVLAWAAVEHPGHPVALSVRASSATAQRLYRRHGFVGVGAAPRSPGGSTMLRPADG